VVGCFWRPQLCLDTIAESDKERKDEYDGRARTTQITVGVQVIACETGHLATQVLVGSWLRTRMGVMKLTWSLTRHGC
jgi:hypothetical protein